MQVSLAGSNAKDHETLNVSSPAVSLAKKSAGFTKAIMTSETADIRYWVDGAVPTTTAGHLLIAGGSVELDAVGQITNFKAIAVTGTAVLQVSYF